jgi:hypothetical protein
VPFGTIVNLPALAPRTEVRNIGLGFSYTHVIGGGLLRQFFSFSLQVSYYW